MKLARRLLSLLLVLLMVFSFAACGGGGDVTDGGGEGGNTNVGGNANVGGNTNAGGNTNVGGSDGGNTDGNSDVSSDSNVTNPGDTEDVFVMPERPVDETKGKTYTILQHGEKETPFSYAQDSQNALLALDRVAEIQDTYGCTIAFSDMGTSNIVTQVQALSYTQNGGDLLFAYGNGYARQLVGKSEVTLLQDLLAVDDIINFWDMDKWGNITARETMMGDGKFYGVSPNLWFEYSPIPYYQLVYNKTIFENAQVTDPQEYWEKGEWDRDAMADVIIGTTDEASGIWGLTAAPDHMARATYLATGVQLAIIDEVNIDGTVKWSNGLKTTQTAEALQWLKTNLTNHAACFNNGAYNPSWGTWNAHIPFIEGSCAMALTRHKLLFDKIVIDCEDPFGLTVWAGPEANTSSGYYESIATVSIPIFAQNIKHSAFLMADLFEGLGEIETFEDIVDYYAENYFESELDLEMLLRPNATLQYSYYPDEGTIDSVWRSIRDEMMSLTVPVLIERNAPVVEYVVSNSIVPNKVAIEQWRQVKHFD